MKGPTLVLNIFHFTKYWNYRNDNIDYNRKNMEKTNKDNSGNA